MRQMFRPTFVAPALLAVGLLAPWSAAAGDRYIVMLHPDSDPGVVAAQTAVAPTHVYRHAMRGFAATLTPLQLARLRADRRVVAVYPDRVVRLPPGEGKKAGPKHKPLPELAPFAVLRIGTLQSPTAKLDHLDDRVDADIAILDTGVQKNHPDLNVVDGVNCVTPGKPQVDGNGHGTHVAGIAAAKDNGFGVVGVAPGARIWAVKVLDDTGEGSLSQVVCGVDWVTAHADAIDVANMSLGDVGVDDGNCGETNGDLLHVAICASVAAGVTYTVSAGNDSRDAGMQSPAAYSVVITVSAFADFDGKPGGLGGQDPGCLSEEDDTFAFFSNFGSAVDLAAPGVCVLSTWIGSSYVGLTGTSMAAPHVAGAAALYLATHPHAAPADARAALLASAEPGPVPQDPDAYPEGIVNVRGF